MMATRESMVLQLKTTDDELEGIVVKADSSWKSPPGGPLPVQEGVWDQLPDGLHLKSKDRKQHLVICRGCNFFGAKTGDAGQAQFPALGKAGTWQVTDTTP